MRKRLKKKLQRRVGGMFAETRAGKPYLLCPLWGTIPLDPKKVLKWARKQKNSRSRRVAFTEISPEVEVSTVFLGIDTSLWSPKPLLYETMIFGGEHNHYQRRYSSRKKAEKGHRRAVLLAQGGEQ